MRQSCEKPSQTVQREEPELELTDNRLAYRGLRLSGNEKVFETMSRGGHQAGVVDHIQDHNWSDTERHGR
jgi:hypothetical protein